MKQKIINMYKRYKEYILYLFFGGATTLISIIIFTVLVKCLGSSLGIANLLAFIGSVIFAYITNEKYVFERQEQSCRFSEYLYRGIKFLISRIGTFLLETLLLYSIVSIGIQDIVAKVIVSVVTIVLNYILSKVWIFNK